MRVRGFTLIELMLTVSIIGILAAIAFPQYQDYVIRSRVAEAFLLAAPAQHGVAQYWARWGRLPPDNAAAGIATSAAHRGRHVDSVAVVKGVIEVQVRPESGPQAKRYLLRLRPLLPAGDSPGPLAWDCKPAQQPASDELPLKWLSGPCR